MKALAAGKHVLLEKPAADTAEEIRQMFELAEKKNLVLMEAFHYRCDATSLSQLTMPTSNLIIQIPPCYSTSQGNS